jgi:hypothetical protein
MNTEEVTLSMCDTGLFFESRQCSIFWSYDSLQMGQQVNGGTVLKSGPLGYFIPDRGFLPAFKKAEFLEMLRVRAPQVFQTP